MLTWLSTAAYPFRKHFAAGWALLAVVMLAVVALSPPSLDAEIVNAPNSESARATQQLRRLNANSVFVIGVVNAKPTDKAALQDAREAVQDIAKIDGVFAAYSYADTPVDMFVADDKSSFLVVAVLDGTLEHERTLETSQAVADRLQTVNGGDTDVGGDAHSVTEIIHIAEKDAGRSELISAPLALIILILVLGGVRVGIVPLLAAGTSIITTIALFNLWETTTGLSQFAMNVTSLFGIGLGIDYGLLIIARFREELAAGHGPDAAAHNTVLSAGRTVLFSSMTVAISMAGLLLMGDVQNASFAIAGITVALSVALISVVFIPPTLTLLINYIKPKAESSDTGVFSKIASFVQGRPAAIAVAVTVACVAMASPMFGMRTMLVGERFLPENSGVRISTEALQEHYPHLTANPVAVVANTFNDDPKVAKFIAEVVKMDGVKSVEVRPNLNGSKIPVVIEIVPEADGQSDAAMDIVRSVRGMESGFDFEVGGRAAQLIDTKALLSERVPLAVGWVVLATFVLLFLMTGSLFVPLKAVAMNCLALAATFGLVVWVFQDGNMASLLGLSVPGYIEIYAPIQVAMFAFGLSMDYEVFLITRIKEVYDRTGDNASAISEAIQKTGSVITAAAALICVVFFGAMMGDLVSLSQFGFALLVAVLLDATVIRMFMVPATMTLMGDLNWWAPAPLKKVHDRFGLSETVHSALIPPPASAEREPVHPATIEPNRPVVIHRPTSSRQPTPSIFPVAPDGTVIGTALPSPATPQPATTAAAAAASLDDIDWDDWDEMDDIFGLSDWAPDDSDQGLVEWFRSGAPEPPAAALPQTPRDTAVTSTSTGTATLRRLRFVPAIGWDDLPSGAMEGISSLASAVSQRCGGTEFSIVVTPINDKVSDVSVDSGGDMTHIGQMLTEQGGN